MVTRLLTVAALTGLAVLAAVSTGSLADHSAGAQEAKPFTYQVVTFVKNDPQTTCRGQMTADQCRKWFKSDYPVAGERVEIPGDATPFGALVLTGGDEVIVLPLYTWQGEKVRHFACQGFKIGRAPRFSVREPSEELFLRSMKERLAALE
jgi:uncharacterized membrane protein